MEQNIVKITGAAYRLLESLPDSDPLKNKAKEKVLAILERQSAQDIDLLKKYFDIIAMQGWISAVNVMILKNGYDQIIPAVVKHERVEKVQKVENFSSRQEKILEFLKINKKAQVADLIKSLPKVTKRTIRRDLDDLLKKRQIIRVGSFNQVFYEMGQGRA